MNNKQEDCDPACKSFPICSLDELKKWKLVTNQSKLPPKEQRCFTAVDGKYKDEVSKNVPRTLVCHDMKGGYLEDSLIDGSPNSKAYSFIQWNFIDVFVYFSHNFITIPPPCWVHAAHLHGVPILGTIITEWEEGTAICKQIFSSKDSVDDFVKSLTKLTLHYNCDGWLINIENPLEQSLVENILYFLRSLKNELIYAGNCGKIIWYDSITKVGKLEWQNELNKHNKDFFDACDGIFLNYVWTPENLTNSITTAEERLLDVYVGVDVFGRNCFGGGGFNTDAAFSEIRQKGLSAAIFAPGWVYECHPIELFPDLSLKFWSLLLPYLKVRGPTSLPIRTSFCPGYGLGKYAGGRLIENEPWYNLSLQQLQPCFAAVCGLVGFGNDEMFEIFKYGQSQLSFGKQELCDTDAFSGGGCLLIQSSSDAIFPLFVCKIPAAQQMMLAIVFKSNAKDCLNVRLGYIQCPASETENNLLDVVFPLSPRMEVDNSSILNDLGKLVVIVSLVDNYSEYDQYGSIFRSFEDSSGWEISLFQINIKSQNEETFLRTISIQSQGQTECKLGYLSCFST